MIANSGRAEEYLPRKSDVALASFERSGNWWLRFVLARLIAGLEKINMEIDFSNIDKVIPFDADYLEAEKGKTLEFKKFPRIVKSHRNCSGNYKRSIYILRDPRDVMVSKYYFEKFRHRKSEIRNFPEFLQSEADKWCAHVASWMRYWNILVRYEDMKKNPEKETKKILRFLKVKAGNGMIKVAVRKASFANMQKSEALFRKKQKRGRKDKRYFFVREGAAGEWKKYFRPDDLAFLKKSVKKRGLEKFLKQAGYNL